MKFAIVAFLKTKFSRIKTAPRAFSALRLLLGARGQERDCEGRNLTVIIIFERVLSSLKFHPSHLLLGMDYYFTCTEQKWGEMEAPVLESRSAHTKSFHPLVSDMDLLVILKVNDTPPPATTAVQGTLE